MGPVACDFWFPEQSPVSRVHSCSIGWSEWQAYLRWHSPPFLSAESAVNTLQRDQVAALRAHLARADWDNAPASAIGCLAALSFFLKQAIEQDAGAWFEVR